MSPRVTVFCVPHEESLCYQSRCLLGRGQTSPERQVAKACWGQRWAENGPNSTVPSSHLTGRPAWAGNSWLYPKCHCNRRPLPLTPLCTYRKYRCRRQDPCPPVSGRHLLQTGKGMAGVLSPKPRTEQSFGSCEQALLQQLETGQGKVRAFRHPRSSFSPLRGGQCLE